MVKLIFIMYYTGKNQTIQKEDSKQKKSGLMLKY